MKRIFTFTMGIMGWITTLFFTGIIIACVAAFLVFQHYSNDLPDYSQLSNYDPPTVTRLYASDGRLLAEYAKEKRVFAPLSAIPRRVIQAFISAEDKNFYQHTGVDLTGIGRAVYTNILNYGQGRSLVGGSTITQQVVKNFLLTSEQSFERKIKEAILALRITRAYDKEKILELYLNEIYLGNRSYGVAVAALNYFNKSLDELTVSETALLAALPKAPSTYNPRRNYDAAKTRRDWVINRMLEDGYITTADAQEAVQQPIMLRAREKEQVVKAEFFAEEVRRQLSDTYGKNVLYEEGLVVRTTVDPELQDIAQKALQKQLIKYDRKKGWRGAQKKLENLEGWRKALKKYGTDTRVALIDGQRLAVVTEVQDKSATIGFTDIAAGRIDLSMMGWTKSPDAKKMSEIVEAGDVIIVSRPEKEALEKLDKSVRKTTWDLQQAPLVNGAFVAIDPHTGRVLAMAGGYSAEGTDFNRATQALRQPGSAFKPFVFLAGLEYGLNPSTTILDGPVELSQGPGKPLWRPQNYSGDYLGPMTMRRALEKSRNTVTVRLAQAIGMPRIAEIGRRYDVYEDLPPVFSTVLGSKETTLMRMTNAYAMIVNGGKRIMPSLIERIDDRNGKAIYRRDARECRGCNVDEIATLEEARPPIPEDNREQISDPRVSYQMVSLLEGVVQRGTAVKAKVLDRPLGGKTGTTNDSKDAWFLGFTPDLVAGVYIGFDQPRTLGHGATGSSEALPAFIDFMQQALKDTPPKPFRIPKGVQLTKVQLDNGRKPYPGMEGGDEKMIYEAFLNSDPIFLPPTAKELSPEEVVQSRVLMQQPVMMPWQQQEGYYDEGSNMRHVIIPDNSIGAPYPAPSPNDNYNGNYQPSVPVPAPWHNDNNSPPVYRDYPPEREYPPQREEDPSAPPLRGTGGIY